MNPLKKDALRGPKYGDREAMFWESDPKDHFSGCKCEACVDKPSALADYSAKLNKNQLGKFGDFMSQLNTKGMTMMFKPFTWRTHPRDHFVSCKCPKCAKLRSVDPAYDSNKVSSPNPFGEHLPHGRWFGAEWVETTKETMIMENRKKKSLP